MGLREDFQKHEGQWRIDAAIRLDNRGAFARAMLAIAPAFITFIESEAQRGTNKIQTYEALANLIAQLAANSIRETIERRRRSDMLDTMLHHIAKVAPQFMLRDDRQTRPDFYE